jgi:dephospho-CoA kinase
MQPGQVVFDGLVRHFGPSVLAADGSLDRGALARIGFGEGRIEEINAIVHPAVIGAQARWMDGVDVADPAAVAIVESALVFETRYDAEGVASVDAPWRTRFDRIVVVVASQAVRRERYIRRVGGSELAAGEDFDRRSAAQWSDERRAALADFLLPNDGPIWELEAGVARLYGQLKAESVERLTASM